MEKLLKLLNEYHHFNSDLIYYWWDEECEKFYFHTELPEKTKKELWDALIDDGIDEQRVGNEWICSKKFWFIKWLVENDKINRWRVENNQDYAEYLWNLPLEEYGTEVLLMLLSIADEPIDYLCNLLFKFN